MTSNEHPIIQKRLGEYERGDRVQKAIYEISQNPDRSQLEQKILDEWHGKMTEIYGDTDPASQYFFMYEPRLRPKEKQLLESLKDDIKKAGHKTGRFG